MWRGCPEGREVEGAQGNMEQLLLCLVGAANGAQTLLNMCCFINSSAAGRVEAEDKGGSRRH